MTVIHSFTLQGTEVDIVSSLLRNEYRRIRKESPEAFEDASPGSWVAQIEDICRKLNCTPREWR
jgi:hypothetical protein